MSQDYRTRIEEAVMKSPIREIPLEFVASVVLTMSDGTYKTLSSDEFYDLAEEFDQDEFEDLGIEGVSFQLDMDYAIEVIHHFSQDILKNMYDQ